MSDPLWERVFVAAIGPLVTALLAVLILDAVAKRAQARRDTTETRDTLATELTETANSLYLALQHFWRVARDIPLKERRTKDELKNAREELAAIYQEARSKGQVLEQRLKIYYRSPDPSQHWHRVTDLLSVRYYLLLEGERERRIRFRKINAGKDHSGLTEDDLNKPWLVLQTYREALAETIAALWNYDLDRSGKHLSGTTAVSTWHVPPK